LVYFSATPAINATTRSEDESANSYPLAAMGQGKSAMIVAVVGKLHIHIACRVTDETCHPDHSITIAQKGQQFTRRGNIHLLAAEI
jgi:hypothetical protein